MLLFIKGNVAIEIIVYDKIFFYISQMYVTYLWGWLYLFL